MVSIADRAMLVTLRRGIFSATKEDKAMTQEIASSHNTSTQDVKVIKALFDQKSYQPVQRIYNEIYIYHRENTLPWLDDGPRLITAACYLPYTQEIAAKTARLEAAALAFADDLDSIIDEARQRLNGAFKDSDYPSRDEVLRRTYASVRFRFIADTSDARIQIGDEERARLIVTAKAEAQEALALARTDLLERIKTVTAKMANTLRDYTPRQGDTRAQGTFKDTLVTNVRDLVNLLPALNLADDPDITRFADRLREDLCYAEPDDLRTDSLVRERIQRSAESILADMVGYTG